MKTRNVGVGLLVAGVTLVSAESAELMHAQEPAKHIEVELFRPLDIGKFNFISAVTTTSPVSFTVLK